MEGDRKALHGRVRLGDGRCAVGGADTDGVRVCMCECVNVWMCGCVDVRMCECVNV